VTNPGDASATNVMVSDPCPGFKFVSASDGGRHFSTRNELVPGEIGPGLTKEVKLEVVAINRASSQKRWRRRRGSEAGGRC
jgi:hypothetical protein